MNVKKIVEELGASPLYAPVGWENLEADSVFASDLISDILVSEGGNQLLLTSLTSTQVVRTAALVGAVAIVLVHRRQTPPDWRMPPGTRGFRCFAVPWPSSRPACG